MASWRIRFHDKWPHLASLYASTHNLDEEGKYPDPMMGQDNVFDPSEPYGAYRYYVQPSTRSEFSIEEPGYMSRPVYKDEESRSSDYTSGDSFRRGSNCRVLLCVSLVVSFIGVVVAAITLAVLLSQSPTPLPEKPSHIDEFESQASIFNREFNENLMDNTTDEFKNLEKEFCKAIEQIFTDADSPVKNAFGGCEVLEFTNGSVQVRYRLKLFSDTFERFKMDKKITKKLEDHFAKKVNEIGPWQNLKFNPKFLRQFIRIEPLTTAVPPTTKTTTTQPSTSTDKATTKSTKTVVKTTSIRTPTTTQTTEHLLPDKKVTRTIAPETKTMKTIESTTTTKFTTTTQADQTTSPIETKETTSVKSVLVTEKESTIKIATQTVEESFQTTMQDKVIDIQTQTHQPESKETTPSTVSDEMFTTTAEVKTETTGNATITTERPEVTTDIFDLFYNLNDTFETTEAATTLVTGQPIAVLEVTDIPKTLKDLTTPQEDMKQMSTISPVSDSIFIDATTETATKVQAIETTTVKDIPQMTQTESVTTAEVTPSQSTHVMTDEDIIVNVTVKPEETTEKVQTVEKTTIPFIDDISAKVTKALVDITEPSIDKQSTEIPPTEGMDISTTQDSVIDEGVPSTVTVKVHESSTQRQIDISTVFTNVSISSSVTTSQETELTTSSAIIEDTKESIVTTTPADVTSELDTTLQPSEALKVVVNETTDDPLITEIVPILNASSITDKLTTKTVTSESSSTFSTVTTTESTIAETVKESGTEGISTPTRLETTTTDKTDIQTTSEVTPADLTTMTLPITVTKGTSATTTLHTTMPEEDSMTSTESPIVTTDALAEVENVTQDITGVSEIFLLSTTDGYNTSDIYYEFETTTASDALVETSTGIPADLISTQEMETTVSQETSTQAQTDESLHETTIQSITTESSAPTEAINDTKLKSEIPTKKPVTEAETVDINVTEQPSTQKSQTDKTTVSVLELVTQKESRKSFLPNATTPTQDEIAITTAVISSKATDDIKVTTLSVDVSSLQTTTKMTKAEKAIVTTSEKPLTDDSSREIPVTETLKVIASTIANDTKTTDVTAEVLPTENPTTVIPSSGVTEISQTAADTTGRMSVTDHATEIIPELSSIALTTTEEIPVTTSVTESHPDIAVTESPLSKETTSVSKNETVQETKTTESLPDVTETLTVVETHTDYVTQSVNVTDSISSTAKVKMNDTAANVTEQEAFTTSSSVQKTTSFDTVSEFFTTETPENITDIIYADSTTLVDIQASTEAENITEEPYKTTTTPKPAEEAFLDEYGEAAFNESYVPVFVNKTEETSVISTSNTTKESKTTTLTVPIATTILTVETGNISDIDNLNISDILSNLTKINKGAESTNISTTNELDVTTDSPATEKPAVESTSDTTDNTTVLPLPTVSMNETTIKSSTRTLVENGTDAETEAANKTKIISVQPLVTDHLQTDSGSKGHTTTVPTETNVTIETFKPENLSLIFNDTFELVPKNESSVQVNKTVFLNITGDSNITNISPVESTNASVYNSSDYYDVYNDTDYYYVTTETPGITSDTPGVTIDAPVENVNVSIASNVTNIVMTGDLTIGTNGTVTVSDVADPITTQSSNVTYESQTVTETMTLLPDDVTEFTTSATSPVP